MAQQNYDELNRLKSVSDNQRSTPYEQYFGEMELSESEKNERVDMANNLETEMLFILSLLAVMIEYGYVDAQSVSNQLKERYTQVVSQYMDIDDYLSGYIDSFSRETVDTTINHETDPYYTSLDRAMYLSENETNTTMNYRQFVSAIVQGKTKKKWVDVRDKKERKTHLRVGGRTINIQEPFMVGDSFMMFPKDTSLGAEAKEIVNCRCSIMYL